MLIDERSMTSELLDLYLEEVKIISENYKKLRDAEKNMQDFISFIAHEIRTPLPRLWALPICIQPRPILKPKIAMLTRLSTHQIFLKITQSKFRLRES